MNFRFRRKKKRSSTLENITFKTPKKSVLAYSADYPWIADVAKIYEIMGETLSAQTNDVHGVVGSVQTDFYEKYFQLSDKVKKQISEAVTKFGHICNAEQGDKTNLQKCISNFSQSVEELI